MLMHKEDFEYFKKIKDNPDYRKIFTAYHEAGHAVAHILLRRWFSYVTIKPKEKDAAGKIMHKDQWPPASVLKGNKKQTRFQLKREIKVLHAGDIAETLLFQRLLYEQGLKQDSYGTKLMYVPSDRADKDEAEYWKKEVGLEDDSHLFKEILDLLDENWQAVELVAAHLLEHNKLKYYEVRKLMRECGAIS